MLKTIIRLTAIAFASVLLFGCYDSQSRATQAQTQPYSNKPPFEFDGDVGGCGNFVVFRSSRDSTKAVGVNVDKEKLSISSTPKTFEIENTDALKVIAEDFGADTYKNRGGYCYDAIGVRDIEPVSFVARKGKATIYVSKSSEEQVYKATVILENVQFSSPVTGAEFVTPLVKIENVRVGWIPG